MKSTPITRIAGTDYGSAPANQEVTKDARGKIPAKFERMSPVKQTTGPIEEDVQDDTGNLQLGEVTYDFSGGTTKIVRQPSSYTWSGPLDTSGNYYEKLAKEEGFKGFKGTIKEYEQSKLKKKKEEGDPNVGEQQGEEREEYVPGSKLAKFAYTPQTREADTFTIRQSRKQDRDVRATKRRLDRAIKRGKDPETVKALQSKYDRKLKEQREGINPYLTKRSTENIKADKDTQTKSEFESKYGTTGFTGLTDFTPSKISFSNPTLPASNNVISDFSGNVTNIGNRDYSKITNFGQNLNGLHNSAVGGNQGDLFNNPKAAGEKKASSPIYKMGGYGSKSYNK